MVLLIIFGTRGVTSSVATGDFWCPSCRTKRRFDHKRVRRFFTLYFIPIVPLDVLGEYVECDHCRDTFTPEVLAVDPESNKKEFVAEFAHAVKRVMVLMMLADGRIDDEELETIRQVYEKVAKKPIDRTEIDAEIRLAKADSRGLRQYLASIVGRLNDPGKELVVKSAFFVAAADGRFTDEETALLAELAGALEMSPTHFKGVVDDLMAMTKGAKAS
jgi:tellurite resistance protein